MSELLRKDKADTVRRMFTHLAGRYDIANRWMTWGQDVKWRGEVIDRARLPMGSRLLDIGSGTGDLAIEARHRDAALLAVGADFTPEMMRIGHLRKGGKSVRWVNNDALDLPFGSETFDAVVSGYLLRNVSDVQRALVEQYRVLKPGGALVCLDTSPPPGDFWHLPARFYLRHIIPIIGGLLTGDAKAYKYLPISTERFMLAEELADSILSVGFRDVGYRRFMGRTMAIHWGVR